MTDFILSAWRCLRPKGYMQITSNYVIELAKIEKVPKKLVESAHREHLAECRYARKARDRMLIALIAAFVFLVWRYA